MTKGRLFQTYQIIIDTLGIAMLILVTVFYPDHDIFGTVFFVVLAIIAETQSIWMGKGETVSINSAVIIAAMLTCGISAAVWVAVASVCGSVTKKSSKVWYHIFNIPFPMTLFNIANFSLAISANSILYFQLGGRMVTTSGGSFARALAQLTANALPLVMSTLAGVLVNTVVFACYLWISKGMNNPHQLFSYLIWPTVSLFFICMMGVFLTALYVTYDWYIVVLFFLPFMLARYVFTTYKELQQNYLQTVESLASAIEAKDSYTSGHSRRVEKYSSLIAQEMKLPSRRCDTLRYAALLHDIGKIGIPESILNKPGRLTPEEWKQVRQHPEKGAHIVEEIEFLSDAVEIIRSHHEWYNGEGYPDGKNAESLPLEAMILCVADSFDAMTSERPYRRTLTFVEAMRELHDKAGTQFSPAVVDAFEKALVKNGELADKPPVSISI